ncbi:hypothetical protein [Nonomuraea dietziae]|uniref:hypothetical protein n=1 Tax=Nonomuraea dietziae TaxID=65515 RepID=UPI0033CFCBE1
MARLHLAPVRARLEPLTTKGLVSICAPTQLELLYSARGPADYAQIKSQLDAGVSMDADSRQGLAACM